MGQTDPLNITNHTWQPKAVHRWNGFDYNETFAPKAELAYHNLQSPYLTVSNK